MQLKFTQLEDQTQVSKQKYKHPIFLLPMPIMVRNIGNLLLPPACTTAVSTVTGAKNGWDTVSINKIITNK
ncbi:hypothetical protein COI44_03545 [Bacillus sp. AFS088145]|nr:hypothetical protein COI44_03545 [Bacillus sp. AFS088145]